jgi:hypothetical protein
MKTRIGALVFAALLLAAAAARARPTPKAEPHPARAGCARPRQGSVTWRVAAGMDSRGEGKGAAMPTAPPRRQTLQRRLLDPDPASATQTRSVRRRGRNACIGGNS